MYNAVLLYIQFYIDVWYFIFFDNIFFLYDLDLVFIFIYIMNDVLFCYGKEIVIRYVYIQSFLAYRVDVIHEVI